MYITIWLLFWEIILIWRSYLDYSSSCLGGKFAKLLLVLTKKHLFHGVPLSQKRRFLCKLARKLLTFILKKCLFPKISNTFCYQPCFCLINNIFCLSARKQLSEFSPRRSCGHKIWWQTDGFMDEQGMIID